MVTIRKATREQIVLALENTNKVFDGNVAFNRFDVMGKNFAVTLKVKDSKKPGHRRGYPEYEDIFNPCSKITKPGRRMSSACWHVYGTFFDELLKVNSDIVIISSSRVYNTGKMTIDKNGGNWEDYDVGSKIHPMYASEMCDCYEEGRF
jgi:hypothetical protein